MADEPLTEEGAPAAASESEEQALEQPEEVSMDLLELQREGAPEMGRSRKSGSPPPSFEEEGGNPECVALRRRMNALRGQHADMHEELLESQKNMRLCMATKSDKAIGDGDCSHWEQHAIGVRERQKRMAEEFQRLQDEMQRACG